ncbi:hypothetical protein HPB51_012005 [Rhipicephalus microplus]|uniref:Uncharacterized protein n=1 Tax=Rhipicephalus microplus TaxID=6941 RepID=A0A9J6F1Q8_RHIMP|nr:hypothetical protein HPB51_012005 [Rhipicephalus microplus]
MDGGEESVAPRRRALSFRRPAVVAAHGSSVVPPAPLSPRLRAVRHKAIGLIRRTLGSLSNSSTPVGSCESLPDAVFASSNNHHHHHKESPFHWGSPPSRPGTPTLAELMSAISSLPPSPTPHVGFLPRVRTSLAPRCQKEGCGGGKLMAMMKRFLPVEDFVSLARRRLPLAQRPPGLAGSAQKAPTCRALRRRKLKIAKTKDKDREAQSSRRNAPSAQSLCPYHRAEVASVPCEGKGFHAGLSRLPHWLARTNEFRTSSASFLFRSRRSPDRVVVNRKLVSSRPCVPFSRLYSVSRGNGLAPRNGCLYGHRTDPSRVATEVGLYSARPTASFVLVTGRAATFGEASCRGPVHEPHTSCTVIAHDELWRCDEHRALNKHAVQWCFCGTPANGAYVLRLDGACNLVGA